MKKTVCLVCLFILSAAFRVVEPYTPVDDGSSVKFKIKNLGIGVDGLFKGLKGVIVFDAARPEEAKFDVTIDAATINSGIELRDKHLRKQDYFDVARYPTIHLVSTKVETSATANTFMMYGNLTIKNVTKAVSFSFTTVPQNNGYIFKGEFKINRRDYFVGGSSITLSDNLSVYLDVFARKI
jgi:polyisoprenoid-binding protein YceI